VTDNSLKRHLGQVFHDLARRKECRIEEGHLMPDHVQMLISIPPKYSVAQIIGYMKGKSSIWIAQNVERKMRKGQRGRGFPMPTKLGLAFLGMTVGGATFLIAGFAVFLTISQVQQRVIEARGPAATQASPVQYARSSRPCHEAACLVTGSGARHAQAAISSCRSGSGDHFLRRVFDFRDRDLVVLTPFRRKSYLLRAG
jgi:hypothetical protein